jgi:transposase
MSTKGCRSGRWPSVTACTGGPCARRLTRRCRLSANGPPSARPPALGPFHALIDEWLLADLQAPPKQRHTARRIFQRLVEEHGAEIGERTVRRYVRARRRELGEPGRAFVPQVHHAAQEAEVDWGEADVRIAGALTRVHLFHLRLCHSGAAYAQAFHHQSQQAFLEAHADAFALLGGVPELVRYDNLRAAVKAVLRGRRREESDRFVALRSHYMFRSAFTLAGLEGAHEKGGVESEVGRYRLRWLVPVPEVSGLA